VKSGHRPWIPKADSKLIYEFLPDDTSRQTHSLREAFLALRRMSTSADRVTLVDLGCGNGSTYDVFRARDARIRWVGLDITDSQEVGARPPRNSPVCAYDGARIPLPDGCVDFVYTHQVFEHVRHPELLLRDVRRVLRPGGVFIGSTSHLEPFHSRSYWNYTPYGFCVLLRDAGFNSIEVRPGIDCLTLIARRCSSYFRLARLFEPFFRVESPMNVLLESVLRLLGQPANRRNAFKLLFAGQFCFIARK
jgi:SAM-dependent methyltransferase